MTGRRQYKITDFRFGQMILSLREKVGLTQQELAEAFDVSRRTIQHWEAGTAFPDTVHLKRLIAYFLARDGFTPGRERDEAVALWTQADESAARRRSMFDSAWFDGLLQQRTIAQLGQQHAPSMEVGDGASPPTARIDWGDAPEVTQVFGRDRELTDLAQWVLQDRCRLVSVLGMGGIGKTTLVVKLAQDIAQHFEYVIWRSLRHAPSLHELLRECVQILSPGQPADATVQVLVELLQQHRCLLILDNFESLHQAGKLSGVYREGYEEYHGLFQALAQARHNSCLLLTSRELPAALVALEGRQGPVRTMKMTGLSSAPSQAMLADQDLFGPPDAWEVFVHYYNGNPLALKIAGATVRDVFGGDLAAFLREAPVTLHTLDQLLGHQFEQLSALEQDILFWLAIERDPVPLDDLRRNFLTEISSNELLAGLLSLFQRSLIERSEQGAVFSLLPVLLEFMTDRLVNVVNKQIINRTLEAISKYALIKAMSPDYVRDSQMRMIVSPVLALLRRHFGGQSLLADHLRTLVSDVRKLPREMQGYAGGNLTNLLANLTTHLRGEDFSGLALRQVYLVGVEAQDTSFAGSEFSDARFTEPLESISAMMTSPSGTYLAACTFNGHMRCWSLVDGKPLWTTTNARRAWSMTFSPDESRLACSNYYGQVTLWDVATGRHLHTFEGPAAWVYTVAFDPTGQFLASGGDDQVVRIWDLAKQELCLTLAGHAGRLWSLAFSPDGELLVSGADEEIVRVWDWRNGRLLRGIRHPTGGTKKVAFHPDGQWIASCCDQDPKIRLWNAKTGEPIGDLESPSQGPASIAFDPEGGLLISGGRDGSVEIWRMSDGLRPQYVKRLLGHDHYVSTIAVSRRNLLATLSYGEDIKLWNVDSGKLLRAVKGHHRLIGAVAFSPDSALLVLGDSGGKIRLWDLLNHRHVSVIEGHTGPIWAIAFSPDGTMFATTGDDRTVRLWDTTSLQHLKTLTTRAGPIWHLAFNHDGSVLAAGGLGHWLELWDMHLGATSDEPTVIETSEMIWSIEFDPGGKHLVAGQTNGTLVVWDLISGKPKATMQHGTVPIGASRFSADGKILITSSNQELLRFWDAETNECIRTVPVAVERNRTKAVAIGEDGKLVATGGSGGLLSIWRMDPTGDKLERQVIEGHTSRVWGLALSKDERFLASGDEEGTTIVTDVPSGQVVEKIALDRPYERMNIRGVTGLNAAEWATLKALGAVEG